MEQESEVDFYLRKVIIVYFNNIILGQSSSDMVGSGWTKFHEPKFYREMTMGNTNDLSKFLIGMPT